VINDSDFGPDDEDARVLDILPTFSACLPLPLSPSYLSSPFWSSQRLRTLDSCANDSRAASSVSDLMLRNVYMRVRQRKRERERKRENGSFLTPRTKRRRMTRFESRGVFACGKSREIPDGDFASGTEVAEKIRNFMSFLFRCNRFRRHLLEN